MVTLAEIKNLKVQVRLTYGVRVDGNTSFTTSCMQPAIDAWAISPRVKTSPRSRKRRLSVDYDKPVFNSVFYVENFLS